MALVVYTEILNRNIHDPLVQCIESDIGQSSEDLALALNRTYTTDGQIILQKLHAEGMLKKVNTEQIVMTPTPSTRIKLNELNKMLDDMKQGEDAVKRMAELDSQMGMQDPAAVARRMRGDRLPEVEDTPVVATSGDALGDTALANNLRQQAERMSREAKGLLAEAENLLAQAASLEPAPIAKTAKKVTPVVDATPVAKTKGRPKKTPVTTA
jgi:hypothetical protein